MIKRILALSILCALSACETPTTSRYSISAATNVALKKIAVTGIGVGNFTEPATSDLTCRLLGPVHAPDGMTQTQYIKKALEDELKVAGVFTDSQPRVTLSGKVEQLSFSSSKGLTGGVWDIQLTLTSSNGKSLTTTEHYEFESGFSASEACRQTAQAFMPAVQDLIQKAVVSPEFYALVAM